MASHTRASTIIPWFAAEDRVTVMPATVMATETAAPTALGWSDMFLDPDRSRPRPVVPARDRMAHIAPPTHELNMSFVCKARAICPADIFGREWLYAGHVLGMAVLTIRFLAGFWFAALWRMADIAF